MWGSYYPVGELPIHIACSLLQQFSSKLIAVINKTGNLLRFILFKLNIAKNVPWDLDADI